MRIVIDMQSIQSAFSGSRGVGRYTDNLVKSLLKNGQEHEFFLALNGAFVDSIDRVRKEFSNFIDQSRIKVWQNYLCTATAKDTEISPPNPAAVKAAELVREIFFASLQPDIVFSTNLQEGFSDPSVSSVKSLDLPMIYATTLHDLTPLHFKKELLSDDVVKAWYWGKIDHAVASDILITDSESSKSDIIDLLNVNPDKVFSVYAGYDQNIFNDEECSEDLILERLRKYTLPRDFIFYFGGNDLCKNIKRLISAYASLDEDLRKRFPLVLGGRSFLDDKYGNSHLDTQQQIADLGVGDFVLAPGFITDQDLSVLLKACTCFVFPSTHEGFGLPALEAMACGAPVIGSNRSSIAEVIGNELASFDPYDEADIARKLTEVLGDADFRAMLRRNGLTRAKHFSWTRAASELLEIFQSKAGIDVNRKGLYFGEPIALAINSIAPLVDQLDDQELADLARSLDETFSPAGKPTIYFDISTVIAVDDRSGIQRVTRAVAAAALQRGLTEYAVDLVYSSADDLNFYVANDYKRKVLARSAPSGDSYVAFKPGDILILLDQAPRMAINHAAYIRKLRNIGVKVYFYVYDLIPLQHPEWFTKGGVAEFEELMSTMALADGAICCSRSTADDVRHYMSNKMSADRLPFQIGYAHLGMDLMNSAPSYGLPNDAGAILAKLSASPSFLMVGTVEPRKGHRQTLEAFEILWSKGLEVNLVIVGRWGWEMQDFDSKLNDHPMLGRNLFWLQGISDQYLLAVYDASRCLLAPSEAEGFGLPLIEAAHRNLPIIARDIPVFREIAGENAHYFPDTRDPKTLALTIEAWLLSYDGGVVNELSKFPTISWQESASELLDIVIHDNWLYHICANSLTKQN
jgi:glycosyltransferase involved in cell wall biosynthesis